MDVLQNKIQKILASNATTSQMNIDLIKEFIVLALDRTNNVLKAVRDVTNTKNMSKLLGLHSNLILLLLLFTYIAMEGILYITQGRIAIIQIMARIYLMTSAWSIMITTLTSIIIVLFSLLLNAAARADIEFAVRKVWHKYGKVIIVLVCITMIATPFVTAEKRQLPSPEDILSHCGTDQFTILLKNQPVENVKLTHVKKMLRLARAMYHPDKNLDRREYFRNVSTCLSGYSTCIEDKTEICYVFAMTRYLYEQRYEQVGYSIKVYYWMMILKFTMIIVALILTLLILIFGWGVTLVVKPQVKNIIIWDIALILLSLGTLHYDPEFLTIEHQWIIMGVFAFIHMILFVGRIPRLPKIIKYLFFVVCFLMLSYEGTKFAMAAPLYRRMGSSCTKTMSYNRPIEPTTVWNIQSPYNEPYVYDTDVECNCMDGSIKKKHIAVLENIEGMKTPLIYHACWRNNIAALNRMAWQTPKPAKDCLKDFKKWLDQVFVEEIEPLLSDISFDANAWFNHLTATKQDEVKDFFLENKYSLSSQEMKEACKYNNFVKSEKQCGLDAKTRCICSPLPIYKYVAGPVTYELEQVFKGFKGYGAPLTWQEQETCLDVYEQMGYGRTIQLDGKGFDITQHYELKELIDYRIYRLIQDRVEHVEPKQFIEIMTPEYRTIEPSVMENGAIKKYGKMKVRGKVFSGSMDTTLMNTIRMALYNRFAIEKVTTDYELWVKGDDVVVFIDDLNHNAVLHEINNVFTTEEKWNAEPGHEFGLGQIAKFVKLGYIIDFDFCSTMVIETKEGYKILRKLDNIANKEHLSVKLLQLPEDSYNNMLRVAANSWLGKESTILSEYYNLVHPMTEGAQPINKLGRRKMEFPATRTYKPQYVHYDLHIQEERISDRSFTNEELVSSLVAMVDQEQMLAYNWIEEQLEKQ
jgi:hypothetical protein